MAEQATDDLILSFDPFEGDFGTPGDKVFTNRMVIARKPGPCSHCDMEIAKGERVRRQTSKFDGDLAGLSELVDCTAPCTGAFAPQLTQPALHRKEKNHEHHQHGKEALRQT